MTANIIIWLGHYRRRTPGVRLLDNVTALMDDLSEPQPDVQLHILPECGGQSHDEGRYVGGALELVVEVSRSSRFVDLGPKRADYERVGVLEYVVAALEPDELLWQVLRDRQLVIAPPDADGLYRPEVFPGFRLDPNALLSDDLDTLLAALDHSLATPEHAAFVDRLAAARGTG